MTTDPTKATEVVDAEDEVVDPATPEPAQEQAQAPELEPDELEPEAARAYDAAVEADDPRWPSARRPISRTTASAQRVRRRLRRSAA